MFTPELWQYFSNVYALPTTFVIDRGMRLVQKHVGMLKPAVTELEARALAGLEVNSSIEQVDPDQPVKLENAAQVTSIPGSILLVYHQSSASKEHRPGDCITIVLQQFGAARRLAVPAPSVV